MFFFIYIYIPSNTVTTLEATDIVTATKNVQNYIFSNSISQLTRNVQ